VYRRTFLAMFGGQLVLLALVIGIDDGTVPERPVATVAIGAAVIAIAAGLADRRWGERPAPDRDPFRFGFRLPWPNRDLRLDPPLRPGEPWRRVYRLRRGQGMFSANAFISEDISMDDPQTQRFWRGVCVVTATVSALCTLALLISHLT
jgi:hypothetical protein